MCCSKFNHLVYLEAYRDWMKVLGRPGSWSRTGGTPGWRRTGSCWWSPSWWSCPRPRGSLHCRGGSPPPGRGWSRGTPGAQSGDPRLLSPRSEASPPWCQARRPPPTCPPPPTWPSRPHWGHTGTWTSYSPPLQADPSHLHQQGLYYTL